MYIYIYIYIVNLSDGSSLEAASHGAAGIEPHALGGGEREGGGVGRMVTVYVYIYISVM